MAPVNAVQLREVSRQEPLMNRTPDIAALFELPVEKRLQLVHDLWDSIADEGPTLPVSDVLIEELPRRKALFDANPESGLTWEDVKRMAREPDA